MAYKKNINDLRESPSIEIADRLYDWGADLSYCDPHVPEFHSVERPELRLKATDFDNADFSSYDCIILLTNHDAFHYEEMLHSGTLVIDTRGEFDASLPNVVRA